MNKQFYRKITPQRSFFSLNAKELIQYRDLLWLFVRRDFVATYKQTILGPLWFFIQPVLMSVVFNIVFNKFGKIPTSGIPPYLFYLAGLTAWNYFSTCLTETSSVFLKNATIFGKVYFPRLITPISIVISNLIKFVIQFALFLSFYLYYIAKGVTIVPNYYVLLLPVLIFIIAGLGLGLGLIFSSLTTKYRDLNFLLVFGIQLFMYATPVIYPLSQVPAKYAMLVKLNPMTGIVEVFRAAFFDSNNPDLTLLLYSFSFMIITLLLGIFIFNKTEQNFMDTI